MKNMKYYMIAFGLAAGVVLGANGVASAWGHGQNYYHNNGNYGLSSEQYEQARAVYGEYQNTLESLYSQMRGKQGELQALRYGDAQDEAKAQALFREMGEIQGQIYSIHAEMHGKMADRGLPVGNMGPGFCRSMDMVSGDGYYGHGHGGHRGYMNANFNGYGRHQGGHW